MDVGMGWWRKWKPVLVMLAIVVAYAVMNIMIKKAIDEGTNRLLLITLRQLIAALILSPIAYFRERSVPRCSAALTQYLFLLGLQYTSATFACAFANILPVLTFLMALLFRYLSVVAAIKLAGHVGDEVAASVSLSFSLARSLLQVRDAESEADGGDREGGRGGRVHRRCNAAIAIQRRGFDQLTSPLGGVGASADAPRRRLHLETVLDGHCRAVRRLSLLLLVVPRPIQGRQEVPCAVFGRRPRLPHQFPSGRRAELSHSTKPLHVGSEDEAGVDHGAVLGKQSDSLEILNILTTPFTFDRRRG
ncbi:hypothetical protein BHM03_00048154 [Ensete ventricosum]|nr:hypothetical protein BHM03_00048154 [Ensete ventricosum]